MNIILFLFKLLFNKGKIDAGMFVDPKKTHKTIFNTIRGMFEKM